MYEVLENNIKCQIGTRKKTTNLNRPIASKGIEVMIKKSYVFKAPRCNGCR